MKNITIHIRGIFVICGLLAGCKFGEDKIIYRGIVPKGGVTSFDISVNESSFKVQLIKIDFDDFNGNCSVEIENKSKGTLKSSFNFEVDGKKTSGFVDLGENESELVYVGSSEGARFTLYGLSRGSRKIRIKSKFDDYAGDGGGDSRKGNMGRWPLKSILRNQQVESELYTTNQWHWPCQPTA